MNDAQPDSRDKESERPEEAQLSIYLFIFPLTHTLQLFAETSQPVSLVNRPRADCLSCKQMSTKPTFDKLMAEEVPLQRAALDLEGGNMPSCLSFFEQYFKCFGPHPFRFRRNSKSP